MRSVSGDVERDRGRRWALKRDVKDKNNCSADE